MDIFEYDTIKQKSESQFRDRGSKFLGFAFQIQTEDEIKPIIEALRIAHPKACHICYSWRLKADASHYRINDDGEPSGSAGRPIYDAIRSQELTHVGVFVVRYFGGTKLGVPGLINAYGQAAQDALQNAGKQTVIVQAQFSISCNYEQLPQVIQFLHSTATIILKQEYGEQNVFLVERPLEGAQDWAVQCINNTLGSYETEFDEQFDSNGFSIRLSNELVS